MVKALVQAFWCQKVLDRNVHRFVGRIGSGEGRKFNPFSRILRLALLPPEIVVAAMKGRQPAGLLEEVPVVQDGQRHMLP